MTMNLHHKLVVGLSLLVALHAGSLASAQEVRLKPDFAVVDVDMGAGRTHFITLLPPKTAVVIGLPPETIVGQLLTPNSVITPQNFARNRVFVEYLHAFIRRAGPNDPAIRQQATKLGSGQLPLIDGRAKQTPGSQPAPEDIIGVFSVRGGLVVGYERNMQHRILSVASGRRRCSTTRLRARPRMASSLSTTPTGRPTPPRV